MKVKLSDLKSHPQNSVIYGEIDTEGEEFQTLVEDIRVNGLLDAIVVNQDNTIISGHRRCAALKQLGYEEVDVYVKPSKPEEEEMLLISYNLTRVKSYRQFYYEIKAVRRLKLISSMDGHTHRDPIAEALGIGKGTRHRIEFLGDAALLTKDARAISIWNALLNGTRSIGKSYNKWREVLEEDKRRKEREDKADWFGLKVGAIRAGDFREVLSDIPDNSVDLVLTDPPYPHQFVSLFGDLSAWASKKLRPGGIMVCYSGEMYLNEVFKEIEEHASDGLKYYWTCALIHEGSSQLVTGVNIQCGWKPVLIYRKHGEEVGKIPNATGDVIRSKKREKDGHKWQQSESGVVEFLLKFSNEGELVVDPFAGSGTTLRVCNAYGRKFVGAEINEEQARAANYG